MHRSRRCSAKSYRWFYCFGFSRQASYCKLPPCPVEPVLDYKQVLRHKCEKSTIPCYNTTSSQQTCGREAPMKKIFGGTAVEGRNQWPWKMSLWWKDTTLLCGLTLICGKWAVTAAHCFVDPATMKFDYTDLHIRYDTPFSDFKKSRYSKTVSNIREEQVHIHPKYSTESFLYDIALVHFDDEIEFTNSVRPACLPTLQPDEAVEIQSHRAGGYSKIYNKECVVIGWGYADSKGGEDRFIKQLTVNIFPTKFCTNRYGVKGDIDTLLCGGSLTGTDGLCSGDSGGPLLCKSSSTPPQWTLEGVVSFSSSDCGIAIPAMFTKVESFVSWIRETMVKSVCAL